MNNIIFHLSFPVSSIAEAKQFYIDGLGCTAGRESQHSMILNLGGHQLVAHVVDKLAPRQPSIYPCHFGLNFPTLMEWQHLLDRVREKGLSFYQAPKHRFKGERIEHRTFFLEDPFHNFIEFKHYVYPSAVFGETQYSQVGDIVD
mgnify:CR=1 FL=1